MTSPMSLPTSSSLPPTARSSDRRAATTLDRFQIGPVDAPFVQGGRDQGAGGAGGLDRTEIGGVAHAARGVDFAPSRNRSDRGEPLKIRADPGADACEAHDDD